MGGFFGVASKNDCVFDLFFGTDYHSHLGTRRGGMAVYGKNGFDRSIHNIENSPFRTKFDKEINEMKGNLGIGCISDYEPQPLIVRSHHGTYAITTVGKINNTDEIVKNFDFSYVKEPNIGTISDKIDTTTNSITWTIPELKSGETAIVQYKLKLKTNYDTNIVNKVLDTNTKLDVTYTDSDNKTDTKSTDITPQVKLTEKLPAVLPKAGSTIFFSFMGIVLVIAVACGIKYVVVKNSMK